MNIPTQLPDHQADWTQFAEQGVGPRVVLIGAGVRAGLAAQVAALSPQRVVLLADETPIMSPDGNLKQWATAQLESTGVQVNQVRLPAGTTASEQPVAAAVAGCQDADVIVTVGSGTMSDIGKVAACGRPHIIVQTAASVNGYADDESVLLVSGVKRTVHSGYAHTLIVDTDVIGLAPPELNRSGLGDMISMFTAPADWYLANQLGMSDGWSVDVALMARRYGPRMLDAASGIGHSDPAALNLLSRLLTLSGISMGVAGQTSPSSGMEHTVSHMLDMWAQARGTRHNLHGAQVGVTTLWASLLWHRVIDFLDSGASPEVRLPSLDAAHHQVTDAFAQMDPSGASGAECWSDYSKKLARLESSGFTDRVRQFAGTWPEHRAFLVNDCLTDPAAIAAALCASDAPASAAALDGSDQEITLWALTNNHLMRNRFNVCDLAFALGLWNRDVAAQIISQANALVTTG